MRFLILTSLASALVGVTSAAAGAVTLTLSPIGQPTTTAQFTMRANCAVPNSAATVSDMIVDWPTLAMQQLNPPPDYHAETALRVDIDAAGKASNFDVLDSSGNLALDTNALRAARDAKFTPQTANCQKVAGSYKLIVDYTN